jgi:hypothetical protein
MVLKPSMSKGEPVRRKGSQMHDRKLYAILSDPCQRKIKDVRSQEPVGIEHRAKGIE